LDEHPEPQPSKNYEKQKQRRKTKEEGREDNRKCMMREEEMPK
jgi:hypothetical protein